MSFDTKPSTDTAIGAAEEAMSRSREAEVRQAIVAVAATATDEDRKVVAKILGKAKTRGVDILTLTPAQAAVLFIETNSRNRDWRYAKSEAYARQMTAGEWALNGESIKFYETGKLADGQHRLGGAALAGFPIEVTIFYGLREQDIATIDTATRRHAADALNLDGVPDAKAIEDLVKTANGYEIRAKVPGVKKLESVPEIAAACRADMQRAQRALAIGEQSLTGISNPILTEKEAARIAYILSKNGWNETDVAARLALFQSGQDASESSPMFRAASMIARAKDRSRRTEKMNALGQLAVLVQAFHLTQKGVGAVQPAAFAKVKDGKNVPDPRIAE